MSGYYKAEAVYNKAVELGYAGHWDGSLSSALNALAAVVQEEENASGGVPDSEALTGLLDVLVTPPNEGESEGGGE